MQTLTEEEYIALKEKSANSLVTVKKFVENLFYPNKVTSVTFNDCPDQYELRGWRVQIESKTGEYTCYFPHSNFKNI
jgi:hypothetical protein